MKKLCVSLAVLLAIAAIGCAKTKVTSREQLELPVG